jgi:hypothetical protein
MPKLLVASQAVTLAQLLVFTAVRTTPGIFASFGFVAEQPVLAGFILFQYIIGPVDEVRRRRASHPRLPCLNVGAC